MNLTDLKIGDRIQERDCVTSLAGGFTVVGIDLVGDQRIGPCVRIDWPERGIRPFGTLKASELEQWEKVG